MSVEDDADNREDVLHVYAGEAFVHTKLQLTELTWLLLSVATLTEGYSRS